jgi:hypothetical protein
MTTSLKELSQKLRQLPTTLASQVTAQAAPALTTVANETFAAGTDPYGVPWAPGADGKAVTLRQTGRLQRFLQYVGIGTKLRVALGVPYSRYQIGKRPVFPRQGAPLPKDYVAVLSEATSKAVKAAMGGQ